LTYIFVADSMVLSSFNFWGGLWKMDLFCNRSGHDGHLRSMILALIENAYVTLYQPFIVTSVLSCIVS